MNTPPPTIAERYQLALEQIARAAQAAGRSPEFVRLVVVTKTHPLETVQQVVEAGARVLGESYAEEAVPKIVALPVVEWHMIGHVQSRKAALVAAHFHMVHSLDSLKLAARLSRFAAGHHRVLPALLELNTSGEASKYGFPVSGEASWEPLFAGVAQILELPGLSLRGLMAIGPLVDDPEQARPAFRLVQRVREALSRHFPQASWDELSMGMSADFPVAIQEGATLVRLGTAILGPRG